jgi:hypothetical protein
MPARIDRAGKVHQLDRPAEPDELVTEEDVMDAPKLARILVRILKDIATIKRRFWPRRTDFEDREVTSGDTLRLPHNFNARVRWWVVDWIPTTPGDIPVFERSATTTTRVLALDVGNSGLVSVRVEVA